MTQRWQKKKAEASHSDDWLMTYADVITLLLCFFAITIITSMPKRVIPPAPPQQIPAPLPPSVAAPEPAPPPMLDIVQGDLPFHDLRDDTEDEATAAPPPATAQASAPAPEPPPVAAASLSDIADGSQGQARLVEKSDRITTLEINSAAFFDSGSATIGAAGSSLLREVAGGLKSDQFKGYQITVEGHTDDTPIHTAQFPSNWELSTARASAVVHFFLDQGIPATSLRAAGYADTFPKAPNRDGKGNPIPANQAENRRVVIKLEKIDRAP